MESNREGIAAFMQRCFEIIEISLEMQVFLLKPGEKRERTNFNAEISLEIGIHRERVEDGKGAWRDATVL